jgi:peptidoglycan hydrolase-like protein with peptidoglycan-binding domain
MKKQTQIAPSFFAKHKTPLIIGSVIFVAAGIGITYYVMNKKKKKESEQDTGVDKTLVSTNYSPTTFTPPYTSPGTKTSTPIRTSSGKVLIKYGSRGSLVSILQRYLKMFKEDLGKTGAKRDGVDGSFGPKTAKAAKKRLGKTVFTAVDIEKMKKALNTLGK